MRKPHRQKVYNYVDGKRHRNMYAEDIWLYVVIYRINQFFKSYWLLMIIVLGLGAGIWLHVQMNKQVCGLMVVECVFEK